MYDSIIRNGVIVDGTGAPPFKGDVAISDGRIVAVGENLDGEARETIDAGGRLVTPGFIDIHTHYDGQVTWDDAILPSSGHGITSVLIGCCGIGFAPVRKGGEGKLIDLTEGVEDIPGTALHVGIPWGWESFPEYLDALAERSYAVDILAHVPHSAVRAYVLGDRAAEDPPATDAELAEITAIVRDGIAAGAIGVATSRVAMHKGTGGIMLPGTNAPEAELLAIGEAMQQAGGGVLQVIPSGVIGGVEGMEGEQAIPFLRDKHSLSSEIEMMRRLHQQTGAPITFTFGPSDTLGRTEFNRAVDVIDAANAAGETISPQFSPRPVGGLVSLGTYHPFMARPTYRSIQHLPLAERAARMVDPAIKAAILSEADIEPEVQDPQQYTHVKLQRAIHATYELNELDYEPTPDRSVLRRAQAEGRDPLELYYDLLLADEGRSTLIRFATGYEDGDLRVVETFLKNPNYLMGLGDGGAHVRFICDANFPTFLLTHWGRDRQRGQTFPIEALVHKLTGAPANLYGLPDRGRIAPGLRADLNVIDFDRLKLLRPEMVADLPTGAERFLQMATGYAMTMVGGVVTRRDDTDSGARPGRLVRANVIRAQSDVIAPQVA